MILYENKFYPPTTNSLRAICLYFLLVLISISCIEHQDEIIIESVIKDPKLKEIEAWFNRSEKSLHPKIDPQASQKNDDLTLTLPFSEKELDWSEYHRFEFSDGREVYEVKTKNKTEIFPLNFYNKYDGKRSELYTETLLFIENPGKEKYSMLILRYYQIKGNPTKINYNNVRPNWTGSIDVFNYQEKHLRTFNFEKGKLISYVRFSPSNTKQIGGNSNTTCWNSITYLPSYVVCIGIDCSIYSGGPISRTECQFNGGGGGSGPPGSFCDDTNCNEFPSPGAGPPLNEELIINNLKDPCAREIFQSIGNASKINSPFETGNSNPLAYFDFASEIYKMFAESKNFNLIISNADVQGKTGITTSIFNSSNGKKEVHIVLSNDYLSKATRLSIARTIIHEMVHGYIIYELNNQNYEFSYHFDENYSKYKTSNRAHHEFMGAYVDMIAFSLKKWDSIFGDGHGNLGDDYYKSMAYGGLFRDKSNTPTDSFKSQVPDSSKRDKIIEILIKEQNGEFSAKGKKCN